MTIYCIKIKYINDVIKGMMEDGLHRDDVMRSLTASLGAKLLVFFEWLGSIILNSNFRGTRIYEFEY